MWYRYGAYDGQGRLVRGALEAGSESEALASLDVQGFVPFEIGTGQRAGKRWNWLNQEIGFATPGLGERAACVRQLAILLKSGVSIDKSLKLLELQGGSKRLRALIAATAEGMAAGKPLSEALALPASGFAADELGLVKAGEKTGALAAVLEDLSAMLDRRVELRGRLVSALVYPSVLLAMTLLSLIVIGAVLIPSIRPLFEQSGATPPMVVGMMTWLGDFVGRRGLELGLGALLIVPIVVAAWRHPQVQTVIESALIRFPLAGPIVRAAEAARVCRTLGMLVRGGAAIHSAVAAARDSARRRLTGKQLNDALDRLVGGASLAAALARVTVLDATARQMIAIGENTNRLDALLLHVAAVREAEAAQRLERLMTLLTPTLTIALGALVGSFIMAVMRAILSINDLAIR